MAMSEMEKKKRKNVPLTGEYLDKAQGDQRRVFGGGKSFDIWGALSSKLQGAGKANREGEVSRYVDPRAQAGTGWDDKISALGDKIKSTGAYKSVNKRVQAEKQSSVPARAILDSVKKDNSKTESGPKPGSKSQNSQTSKQGSNKQGSNKQGSSKQESNNQGQVFQGQLAQMPSTQGSASNGSNDGLIPPDYFMSHTEGTGFPKGQKILLDDFLKGKDLPKLTRGDTGQGSNVQQVPQQSSQQANYDLPKVDELMNEIDSITSGSNYDPFSPEGARARLLRDQVRTIFGDHSENQRAKWGNQTTLAAQQLRNKGGLAKQELYNQGNLSAQELQNKGQLATQGLQNQGYMQSQGKQNEGYMNRAMIEQFGRILNDNQGDQLATLEGEGGQLLPQEKMAMLMKFSNFAAKKGESLEDFLESYGMVRGGKKDKKE